jgi:hypothetical protein
MVDIIVKDSPIHGKGVFAGRDFKKGEIVLKWNTSHKLTKVQYKRLPSSEKGYVIFINGDYVLMPPPERYMNHSCEPNTHPTDEADVAVREIKKGEEVTSDYSSVNPPDVKMQCNCGSKSCRQVI